MSESSGAASDATESAATVLGVGMTHRARSQSVLARHWSPVGVVGAVGRASVGFGLAVGRSRSIRPTVRFDDLNTAALRPSFDMVRRHRGTDGVEHVEPLADHVRRVSERDVTPPTPVAAQRAAAERSRRHPKRRARPTWTEQIIQRSSIGFTTPAPRVEPPAARVPADFVPSGDARLDHLRLLVSERDQATARGSQTVEVPRQRQPGERSTPDPERTVLRRTIADEPTIAAPVQGPGRLARSLQPESAIAPSIPDARLGGPPAPSASGAAPAGVTSRATSTERRSASRPARSPQPSRLDQLRSILVEQGILESEPGGDDSSSGAGRSANTEPGRAPAGPAGSAQAGPAGSAPADPRAERRPTSTSSDLQRSAAARVASVTRSVAPTPTAPTPTAPAPTPTSPRSVENATDDRPTAGVVPSPQESSSRFDSDRSRPGALAVVERATTTVETPVPVHRQPAAASALQLRAQRLLRSGLAPDAPSPDAVPTDTPTSDLSSSRGAPGDMAAEAVRRSPQTLQTSDPTRLRAVDLAAEPVRTSASIDNLATGSLPTLVAAARPMDDVQLPSLARVDSSPATVIRRVTLPRALSRSHRPAALSAVEPVAVTGRSVPDAVPRTPAGQVQRVSTVTLAEAATAGAPTTPTQGQERTGDPTNMPAGFTGRLVAPEARPLLQVVRRIAATDADLSHGEVTRTITTTPAATTTTGPAATKLPASGAPQAESAAVGRVRREPAEEVADQFMSVLSETIRRRPAPLPTTYRPLADAIAGPRPVMLSTDSASRKALRSVGKVAATTGDTIHLDRQAISAARLDEVMAHELTHVAHPSPTPRFFDDIDDSPEERRAEQVAKLMSRSPLAPSATTSAPPVRRSSQERTIRRSAAATGPASSSPGTVSAASLAAGLTGSGSQPNVVQRWETAKPTGQRPKIGSHRASSGPVANAASTEKSAPSSDSASNETATDRSDEWFREQLDANLDRVVRMLEDRMIVELERRGGRAWRQS